MAKKVQSYIKLQIPAGKANPSPPIGPALGQRGVNIMEFCKEFNKNTSKIESSTPVPVVITVYTDRSFSFTVKSPPVSYLLKKAAGIEKGSSSVKSNSYIGQVTIKQVEEIANTKIADSNTTTVQSMMKMIEGSARSIGIEVIK